MAKLDRLIVRGYKSIEKLDLELTNLNILIGANGAGKSNLISFFKMLNEMIDKRLQLFISKAGGSERVLYFGSKNTDQIQATLLFGQNSYEVELEPTQEGKLMFATERISYRRPEYPSPWSKNLGAGHLESLLFKESKDNPGKTVVADHIISSLRDWKLYHFHDTGDTSRIKSDSDINDNNKFHPDASNLAAFLYRLKETEYNYYLSILKTVRLIAPFIDDFVLEPSKLNEGFIRLAWRHSEHDGYFDVSQLSDGTLRFICIATLLLQPELPTTILLDEPELGLHPYAINVLASLFKSVSKKTQIIVSTQSLLLVDQFSPEDIVVVNYNQKSSEFTRLDTDNLQGWLEEYTLGELWEKNILGGRPR